MRSHYSDPTANTAIANILREERRKQRLAAKASRKQGAWKKPSPHPPCPHRSSDRASQK